jgi:Domain of unknown function DUF11
MRRLVVPVLLVLAASIAVAVPARPQTDTPLSFSGNHGRVAATVHNATNRQQVCNIAVDTHFGYASSTPGGNASAVSAVGRIGPGAGCASFEITLLRVGFDTGVVVDDLRPASGQDRSLRDNGRTPADTLHNRVDFQPDATTVLGSSDWHPVGCGAAPVASRVSGRVRFANGHLQDVTLRGGYTNPMPDFCQAADLEVDLTGPPRLQHEQTAVLRAQATNHGPSAVGDVTAAVNLDDDLAVVTASSWCAADAGTADPNDYTCDLGTFSDGWNVFSSFTVRGTALGVQTSTATVTSSSSFADSDSDTLTTEVIASADLSLDMSLASADPTPAPGSRVTVEFAVTNAGPDATTVGLNGHWPNELGPHTVEPGGDGGCSIVPPLLCSFGTVAAGTTETMRLSGTITAAPGTQVPVNARLSSAAPDPDDADRADSVVVTVTA